MHPGLRTVFAVVVALAAWLVASPVMAATSATSLSAPQCDQRQATTFGPTPTLDPPNASIDVGDADDSDYRLFGWSRYEQGRAPSPDSSHAMSEAVLVARPPVTTAPFVRLVAPHASVNEEYRGVHQQIERPPR